VGFNLELQQIVRRTFTEPRPAVSPAWRREAGANTWQSLGEAYLVSGQRAQARDALWRAVRADPMRPKAMMAAALWLDACLGTHLGAGLRRWRYRLPDAPPGSRPFEMIDA
jgi:Tfp pilus assembly protein PilF